MLDSLYLSRPESNSLEKRPHLDEDVCSFLEYSNPHFKETDNYFTICRTFPD